MAKGKSLDDYRAKRDFERTPEPPPGPRREGDEPVFVVHRHDASRLHFDLRLEMEGVLRSWAVPKGFSYDPDDKHLAVRTEDHPMEYEDFHGVIPKGEYGAGTMTIWDRGRYEVVKADSAPEAVQAGELKIILYGRKLRGEWHLVKTKQAEDTWLLFKSRDRYSGVPRDSALGIDLAGAVEAPVPGGPDAEPPTPMEPGESTEPFSDPGWVFEMRFAGRRVFAVKRGEELALLGTDGEALGDPGELAPSIARGLAGLGAENAVLDGVLVVVDENERPSAERLAARLRGEGDDELLLYAFDLLHYEEFDLCALPLVERKAALRAVLAPSPQILFVDHVPGDGLSLAEACRAAGLPGLIAKRAEAPYVPGPSEDWRAVPLEPQAAVEAVSRALGRKADDGGTSRVKLTNLAKVYWPAEGFTKGDLLAYYDRIAPYLLPHLEDRPVHMNRFPDGIEGKSFYQKDTKEQFPDWIETEEVESSKEEKEATRYPVIGSRDALLFLVNLGSIDMHPWLSRRADLTSPDFAVIDLDPKGAPFSDVITIAREVRDILTAIDLRGLLKTSGSTGLHIYVPLLAGYTYDHTRLFCEGLARLVASRLPQIATVERVVGNREGKVYVDFLQNRRGQTLVPPYSVRPVRGATVSTPLAWDELTDDLTLAAHTILTVPPRVEERGDLFAAALTDKQDLLPAIEKLGELAAKG